MASFDLPVLDDLRESDLVFLRKNGFTVVEQLLSPERIEALRESFPKLFSGKFDTGVYPDEWYWREGISLQDVTRHMTNAWKADLTIARLALSANIGRATALMTPPHEIQPNKINDRHQPYFGQLDAR